MDKIAMYKEYIYKIAKDPLDPPEDFKEAELKRILSHAFSYFSGDVKSKHKDDVSNKLKNSEEFKTHVGYEWEKRRRERATHPGANRALYGMAAAGGLLGGIIKAPRGTAGNILKNRDTLLSIADLVNAGSVTGFGLGFGLGSNKKSELNEKFRQEMFGSKLTVNSFKDAKDFALKEIRKHVD